MRAFSPVEVWYRNIERNLNGVAKVPVDCHRIVWDKKYVDKKNLDVRSLMSVFFGGRPWRALVVGRSEAKLYADYQEKPIETWGVWRHDVHGYQRLLTLFRGKRRFVITIPHTDRHENAAWREFERMYRDALTAYPNARPHINGCFGFSRTLGLNPTSADFNVVGLPRVGKVILPNGRLTTVDEIAENPREFLYWVRLAGSDWRSIQSQQGRVEFMIQSTRWAALNWGRSVRAVNPVGKYITGDQQNDRADESEVQASHDERRFEMARSDVEYEGRRDTQHPAHWFKGRKPLPGDKIVCDTCSLANVCKEYRQGAVCGLGNTDGESLKVAFGTRDSHSILDGMTKIMELNAKRIESAIDAEDVENTGLDPELTKLLDTTFKQGERMAKIIDPSLRPGPAAQVLINNSSGSGPSQIESATPQQLTATVVLELERQGYKREDITSDMVISYIQALGGVGKDGKVVDRTPFEGDYIEGEVE